MPLHPPAGRRARGLVATVISGTQINLVWNDNSTNETAFKIDRQVDSGSWTTDFATVTGAENHDTPNGDVGYYADTSVTTSHNYAYRVRATNNGVDSANCTATSALTPSTAQTVFNGPHTGGVQAEDFDNGGEDVAYNDLVAGNQGNVTTYRTPDTNVDMYMEPIWSLHRRRASGPSTRSAWPRPDRTRSS